MMNAGEKLSPVLMTANVFTLCSLVFAQPVFDVLRASPEFFVANRLSTADVYLMVFALSAVVPVCVALPVLACTVLGKRVRAFAQAGVVFVLVALLFVRLLNAGPTMPGAMNIVGAAVLGGGFAALYYVDRRVATTLGWVTPIVVLFPVMFLYSANMRELLREPAADELAGGSGAGSLESLPPIVVIVWDLLPLVDLLDAEGNIDAKRFPNFHVLASESTWYENATTVWPTTPGALPAILTGTHPTAFLPRFESYPRNLFTMIEGHYELNVHESITQLRRPLNGERGQSESADHHVRKLHTLAEDIAVLLLHLYVPTDYARRLPAIDHQWGGFLSNEGAEPDKNAIELESLEGKSPDEIQRALNSMSEAERLAFQNALAESMTPEDRVAFVESMGDEGRKQLAKLQRDISDANRPLIDKYFREGRKKYFEDFVRTMGAFPKSTLHFIHVTLPHPPGLYLPSGQVHTPQIEYQYPAAERNGPVRVWSGSQDELNNEHQRLRLQMGLSDRLLGSLMAEMRRLGIYDDSLIVVCADHGGCYIAGEPSRWPTAETLGHVAFIPLFIKYPNQPTPQRNAENVEIIDIVPTISDVLGAELDWKFDGRSLADPSTKPRATKRLPPPGGHEQKFEYTESEYMRARREAHTRVIKTFSLDDPRADLFHYGEGLEFIGKDVSAIESRIVNGSIDTPDAAHAGSADARRGSIPPRIRGTVTYSEAGGADLHVAVIINGAIEAIVPVYEMDATLNFEAILNDETVGNEPGELDLALVDLRAPQ
jgi:hypothetical protein